MHEALLFESSDFAGKCFFFLYVCVYKNACACCAAKSEGGRKSSKAPPSDAWENPALKFDGKGFKGSYIDAKKKLQDLAQHICFYICTAYPVQQWTRQMHKRDCSRLWRIRHQFVVMPKCVCVCVCVELFAHKGARVFECVYAKTEKGTDKHTYTNAHTHTHTHLNTLTYPH